MTYENDVYKNCRAFTKTRQGKNILYFFERLGDFSSINHFTLRAPESQHFLEVQSILFYSSWKLARNMSWKLTGAARSLLKYQSHSQGRSAFHDALTGLPMFPVEKSRACRSAGPLFIFIYALRLCTTVQCNCIHFTCFIDFMCLVMIFIFFSFIKIFRELIFLGK